MRHPHTRRLVCHPSPRNPEGVGVNLSSLLITPTGLVSLLPWLIRNAGLSSCGIDVPLAFALVPAAGSLLTGSDVLKDVSTNAILIVTRTDVSSSHSSFILPSSYTTFTTSSKAGHPFRPQPTKLLTFLLISVPWKLYMSARARRPSSPPLASIDDRTRELARSELRLAELIYLFFTIIAPFLGAFLLRYISKV